MAPDTLIPKQCLQNILETLKYVEKLYLCTYYVHMIIVAGSVSFWLNINHILKQYTYYCKIYNTSPKCVQFYDKLTVGLKSGTKFKLYGCHIVYPKFFQKMLIFKLQPLKYSCIHQNKCFFALSFNFNALRNSKRNCNVYKCDKLLMSFFK